MPAKRRLYCPTCGSDDLQTLGSNGIEPRPGHLCLSCSQKLRRRGSGWFYTFVMGLGLVMIPLGAGSLIWGLSTGRFSWMSGVACVGGLICFVYAILRLTHPVPLLERPALDYHPQPKPEPPPRAVPVEQPAPALPVWRVSGILNQTGFAVIREIQAESGVEATAAAELDGMTVTQVDRVS